MYRAISYITVTLVTILFGVLLAALVGPFVLDAVEAARGPVVFEFALRWQLLIAAAIWFIIAHFFWRLPWWAGAVGFITLAVFAVIAIFDVDNELQKEFSWIRYPTAGALFLASALAFYYSMKIRGWFWGLFTFGFLYAGLDELLEIHERVGAHLEKWFHLPHVTTDLITVFYGLAGAVVTVIALRYLWTNKKIAAGRLLLSGVVVFAVSQALDTLDIFIDPAFRKLALFLSERGYFFGDSWYFFYEPKRFANSLEELLEYIAGVLFVLVMVSLLLGIHHIPLRKPWTAFTLRAWILSLTLLILAIFSIAAIPAKSPLESDPGIVQLGGPKNGLFHSDDLFFDSTFGVLLANEGGRSVLQWKDKKLTRVADPKRVLGDMDSVTAANGKIYVADGDAGKIFSSTGDGVWEVVADRIQGLKHPEALVVVDDTLIGVDESEKGLFRLPLSPKESVAVGSGLPLLAAPKPRSEQSNPEQTLEWYRPDIAGFTAPEGIDYDKEHKRLLVTDDRNGTLWSIIFGQSAEHLSLSGLPLKNPEDIEVLPNGDILLSDNGRGEVLYLTSDRTLKSRLQFRRMYRDLQGIATDTEGNLYVVTADGYASASFMPSFLWKVSGFIK